MFGVTGTSSHHVRMEETNMSIPKKFQTTMILIVVLIFSSMKFPPTLSEETVDTNEVLYFLEEVANVDVSKYETELVVTTSENWPELGGISQITGKYTLESEESTVDVLFKFTNNTLCYCATDVVEGEIYQHEELPLDIKSQADVFLKKYKAYTADPTIQAMRFILDTVNVTENCVKVIGNWKLEVTIYPDHTSLRWKNTFNGADYTGLGVSFRNGTFAAFSQDRSYIKIGCTDVNLSKEDAIDLALRHAKDLSWELLNGTKVTEFTIVENKIGAALLTQSREPLTFYPYWLVILPLDKMYPGFIAQIMFQVWADTGEVIMCTPLGQGGDIPSYWSPSMPDDDSTSQQEDNSTPPAQQEDEPTPSMDSLIIIAATATTIAIAITMVTFNKSRKKSTPLL